MAKSWTCDVCKNTVSEFGAYVKISLRQYAHLACVEKVQYDLGFEAGREAVLKEQADKIKQDQEQAVSEAKLVFERARRCAKCGIAMLEDRPAALHGVYPTALPSSSDARQCAGCVRAEVQARAGARGQQAPASAAEAIRSAPTRPVEAPKPEKAEEKKDRFELLEIE